MGETAWFVLAVAVKVIGTISHVMVLGSLYESGQSARDKGYGTQDTFHAWCSWLVFLAIWWRG